MKTRRELLKQIPLITGSLALGSCASAPFLPKYRITNSMILQTLMPHFPFNKNFAGIGSVTLTAPQVSFAPDINKVRLNMGLGVGLNDAISHITGIQIPGLTTGNTQQQGTCQIACGLRYDRYSRGIYLKDPTIEDLQLSSIASSYTSGAKDIINALAPTILDQYPIHTLQPSIATTFLGSMTVQNNGISLGFGI